MRPRTAARLCSKLTTVAARGYRVDMRDAGDGSLDGRSHSTELRRVNATGVLHTGRDGPRPAAPEPLRPPARTMNASHQDMLRIDDELDLLAALVPLADQRIVELGCGAAALARRLLLRYPGSLVTGIEVDASNSRRTLPHRRPASHSSPALQDIAFADGAFDLALMLKSLHHVPPQAMARALARRRACCARVGTSTSRSRSLCRRLQRCRMRLFNDEGEVRAAAQAAIDAAIETGRAGAGRRAPLRDAGWLPPFRGFRTPHDAAYLCHPPDRRRQAGAGPRPVFEPHLRAGVPFHCPMHARSRSASRGAGAGARAG